MRVTLTRNINKDIDYVNGMTAIVEGATPHGIRARTKTGYVIMLYPWTDEDRTVFYPFRSDLSIEAPCVPQIARTSGSARRHVALAGLRLRGHRELLAEAARSALDSTRATHALLRSRLRAQPAESAGGHA